MVKLPKCTPPYSRASSSYEYFKNTVLPAAHCFQNWYLHFTHQCTVFCGTVALCTSVYYSLRQIINTTESAFAFVCILLEAQASGLLSSSSTSLHPSFFVLIGCKYMENTTSHCIASLQQAELFSDR